MGPQAQLSPYVPSKARAKKASLDPKSAERERRKGPSPGAQPPGQSPSPGAVLSLLSPRYGLLVRVVLVAEGKRNRSPRTQVAPRAHRGLVREESKKRHQDGAVERVFGQMATAATPPDPGAGRRYVDASSDLLRTEKKSHRRAHSMSVRGLEQQQELSQLSADQQHSDVQAPAAPTVNANAAVRPRPVGASQSSQLSRSFHNLATVSVPQNLNWSQSNSQQPPQLFQPQPGDAVRTLVVWAVSLSHHS